ncbi:MAG: amino acid adenylation domain-containing protein, partial [bacterium]|nr:amino acid adenylation domain-containing protein [bacterium]
YTSGSTGRPKGAMNLHQGICNRLLWMQEVYRLTLADNVLQKTPFSFDVSVWEFFWPLLEGARLTVAKPGGHKESDYLVRLIAQQRITTLHFVPSMLQVFLQEPNLGNGDSLKRVICSGEALSVELQAHFFDALPETVELHNLYGPTEAAVDVTYWPCQRDNPLKVVPIGRPIANTQIYILDATHNPTPPGIPGELCIAGTGLARGYLNRPELTSEKFRKKKCEVRSAKCEVSAQLHCKLNAAEPQTIKEIERSELYDGVKPHHNFALRTSHFELSLYHTGDLARWLPDGNLEFLGRLDHQIKLRGFRIELTEIEITLVRYKVVNEAVVVIHNQENNPRLIAYVTLLMPVDNAAEVLRDRLKAHLPEYMIPDGFMVLEELPLTPNGKIDRNALPAPDLPVEAGHQAPGTETEHLLCNLWSLVLGIEVTGIDSHFFKVGGHSLKATLLVSRIRGSFGIEVPLQMIFERPLLREQAQWLDSQQRGPELPPIVPLKEGEPLVLSFAQQRLWFLAQLEGHSATYNMPFTLHLEGPLDVAALNRSLTALVERHHSLRLCFPAVNGEAVVKLNDVFNPLSVTDLSEDSGTDQQHRVTDWMNNHAQTPFDLSTGPLMKVRLLKLGKQDHMLLFNMHHIINDGWSMGVLIREWNQLYNAYAQKREAATAHKEEPVLPEPAIQYTDYAAWQRGWLEGDLLEQQLEYWISQLADAPELLELPTDYPRPAVIRHQGKHLKTTLEPELTKKIKQLSRKQGVTVFMTLLAAFNVLLSRYSGQTDLVVGSPIANRTNHQTEDLIGFFVNTLVLRNHINGEQTVSEFLKQVRQTSLAAYSRQDIPFEYLVERLNPSRSLSFSPLFQVLLVLQNTPEGTLELSGLKMSLPESELTTAKFDLTLNIAEQGEVFVCNWQYNTDLFRPDTITRMSQHFRVLLEGILYDPEQPVNRLPLLTEAEKHQLLDWNQTEVDYPLMLTEAGTPGTIVDIFQEQVKKTPDHVALVFEERQLSYRELNTKANQLAHYLMSEGVGADPVSGPSLSLVGMCFERSLEMLIGFWGILKAGGAYVPLDPSYPVSRLQFMVEDFFSPLILSLDHLREKLPTSTAKIVCLDNRWKEIAACSGENPRMRKSGPESLAYAIYTSGSTGMPKGTLIGHSALFNHMWWMQSKFPLSARDKVLQKTPFSFDASVWEFFASIPAGGILVIAKPGGHQDPEYLTRMLIKDQVTVLRVVPSLLQMLLSTKRFETCIALRYLFCGGESITNELRQAFYNTNLPARFYNFYGPTEATLITTEWFCDKQTFPISIGRPIANTQVTILDIRHNPTPPGIPGELCIAGAGLARGYLNRPELTAERFINHKLQITNKNSVTSASSAVKLYKTG